MPHTSSMVVKRAFIHGPQAKMFSTTSDAVIQKVPKKAKEADFIDRYGGTMFLTVVGGVCLWIWRWVEGSSNRRQTESTLKEKAPLEPNEINDLRLCNHVSTEEYRQICAHMRTIAPTNGLTYLTFVKETKLNLTPGKDLRNMHLLDRVIVSDPFRGFSDEDSASHDESEYAVDFLLVALNMLVDVSAPHRCTCLLGLLEKNADNTIRLEQAERLVDCMMRTCQMPAEKMVAETGTHFPYTKHRRASAKEVLDKAIQEMKLKPAPSALTEEQLSSLLLCNSVCAWGECYRSKKT